MAICVIEGALVRKSLHLLVAHLFTVALLFGGQACVSAQEQKLPVLVIDSGHTGWVRGLAFSADGHTLASCSDDNSVKLWDVTSGHELKTFLGHRTLVNGVAFSPDSKTLASVSGHDPRLRPAPSSGTLKVWDAKSGRELRTVVFDNKFLTCVAYSPDGNFIAVGGDDKTVYVVDAKSGAHKFAFQGHTDSIASVAFSPDSKFVMSGSRDQTVRFWDCSQGRETADRFFSEAPVTSAVFNKDASRVLVADESGDIAEWDKQTCQILKTFKNANKVNAVSFDPLSQRFATANENRSACVWNLLSGQRERIFADQTDAIHSLAYNSNGTLLATGSDDGSIDIWQARTGRLQRKIRRYTAGLVSIALSSDNHTLASASCDQQIKLFDLRAGKQTRLLNGRNGSVSAVAFHRDGITLAAHNAKAMTIWDASTGNQVNSFPVDYHWCFSIAFSPDGHWLATGAENKVQVWYSPSGKWDASSHIQPFNLLGHTHVVAGVAFSPDNRTLATTSWDHTVRLWNLETRTEVKRFLFHSDLVNCVAFSPDGRVLASGGADTNIELVDLSTGKELKQLAGHSSSIICLGFTPDGKTLLSGSADHTVKVWDTESFAIVKTLVGHSNAVNSLLAIPNTTFYATASGDGTIRIWSNQGETKCTIVPVSGDEWVAVDQAGRYDGTSSSFSLLHWRVSNELVELNQMKQSFYDPGLVSKLFKDSDSRLRVVSALGSLKLFPSVSVSGPGKDEKLHLLLRNRGGGIGRIEVRVNGKEVSEDAFPPGASHDAAEVETALDLSNTPVLSKNPNSITVVAHNASGDLASPDMHIDWTPMRKAAAAKKISVYAIIAGVSEYADSEINLKYSNKDAQDFANAVAAGATTLFEGENVHVTVLGTGQGAIPATKANFEQCFKSAESANPEDILIVYLAGHGITRGDGDDVYYYLTRDAKKHDLNNPKAIQQEAISSHELTEWVKKIPALKQVLILDTCGAGAAASQLIANRDVTGDQVRAIERMKDRSGFYVLMGCAADNVSYESAKYRQGILTYAILQGLKGAALRDESLIDVGMLFQYAADTVPKLASGVGGDQSPLIAAPQGNSFVIGMMSAENKKAIKLSKSIPLFSSPKLVAADFTDDLDLSYKLKQKFRNVEDLFIAPEVAHFGFSNSDDPDSIKMTGGYVLSGDTISTINLKLSSKDKRVSLPRITGSKTNLDGFLNDVVRAINNRVEIDFKTE